MEKKKVLAIISARGGSKGIPGKNLKDLGGIPLIGHIFNSAKKSNLIDKIICSSDSEEIIEVAKNFGIEVPFKRPKNEASDRVPLVSSTKYAMEEMDKLGYQSDIVAQLSGTCPFIKTKSIDKSIEAILTEDCDSAVSLKRIEHEHPYRARVIKEGDFFENFIQDINVEDKKYHSRQDLPELYCTSGGIYTRKRFLLDEFDGSDFAMGKKRKAIFLDDYEAINIDRLIDLDFARFIYSRKIQQS